MFLNFLSLLVCQSSAHAQRNVQLSCTTFSAPQTLTWRTHSLRFWPMTGLHCVTAPPYRVMQEASCPPSGGHSAILITVPQTRPENRLNGRLGWKGTLERPSLPVKGTRLKMDEVTELGYLFCSTRGERESPQLSEIDQCGNWDNSVRGISVIRTVQL